MNTNRDDHNREWEDNFSGFQNVRIVPQGAQSQTGERRNVHYPLARYIAEGGLSTSQFNEFKNYLKDSILVLNNFILPLSPDLNNMRHWKSDKRPDIIAVTKEGEICIIQCKQRNDFGKNMEKEFYAFTALLDFASDHPIILKNRKLTDPWDKWEGCYNKRYLKDNRFPDLGGTLAQLFGMSTRLKQTEWANDVMKHILDGNVRYGVAFDGNIDKKILNHFDEISSRFNRWSNGQSELYLFMVNFDRKTVNINKLQNILNEE